MVSDVSLFQGGRDAVTQVFVGTTVSLICLCHVHDTKDVLPGYELCGTCSLDWPERKLLVLWKVPRCQVGQAFEIPACDPFRCMLEPCTTQTKHRRTGLSFFSDLFKTQVTQVLDFWWFLWGCAGDQSSPFVARHLLHLSTECNETPRLSASRRRISDARCWAIWAVRALFLWAKGWVWRLGSWLPGTASSTKGLGWGLMAAELRTLVQYGNAEIQWIQWNSCTSLVIYDISYQKKVDKAVPWC